MKYQKKSKLMKTLYKTLLFSMAVLILGTSGACKGLAQEDSQPAAKTANTNMMEAQIGQVKVTGRHLQGCSFTFPNLMAMEGMTNWQGHIVFSVNNEAGNGKDKVLKALTMNLDGPQSGQTELETAMYIFDKGVLGPKENIIDSYFWPSTDGTYLYFGTVHGFTDYKDNTMGPVNDLYGAVRLAIDPANKTTAYAYSSSIKAMGSLENGQFVRIKNFGSFGNNLGFTKINAVAVGQNHNVYAAGVMPEKDNKIGIYTPDLRQLALVGTDGSDKSGGFRSRNFVDLAVTSHYIFSWKQEDSFTTTAQLCLWDLDGNYEGQVSAEQVLGEGWQPVAVTAWDDDSLLVAAAKLTGHEEKVNPESGNSYTDREWTYEFFLLTFSGSPSAKPAKTAGAGPANVASTTPLASSGTGIITQDTEAVSIISRVRRYELKKGDVLPILRTEDRSNAAGQRETWYIVEIDGAAYSHSGKDRLELPASVFSPQP